MLNLKLSEEMQVRKTTLQVKFSLQWPIGDQLFGFSRQGIFLGAKIY